MMKNLQLNALNKRNGIDKKALGRGIGSGCGKTCSYGHKGGKARSGRGKVTWFEGGQTPLYRRLPKRGFVSMRNKSAIAYINLDTLQKLCDANVFSAVQIIDIDSLKKVNAIRKTATNLRLLAKGKLTSKIDLLVNYASDTATRAVEASGGTVKIGIREA